MCNLHGRAEATDKGRILHDEQLCDFYLVLLQYWILTGNKRLKMEAKKAYSILEEWDRSIKLTFIGHASWKTCSPADGLLH